VADSPTVDFTGILQALLSNQVDFVVVGGVSAVLNGAPISTFDLDIVHSRAPDNIERLLQALEELNARYRQRPNQRPDRGHLSSSGHQLLSTRSGPLDVLGTIGRGLGYEELVTCSVEHEVSGEMKIRVLNLDTLIEIKEELDSEKDRAVLPILRRALKTIQDSNK